MPALHRFKDWPLRAKMAVLLVMASLLPLGVATWISIGNAREQMKAETAAVLAARGDQLAKHIDTFNRGYQSAVGRMALVPEILALLQGRPGDVDRQKPGLRALLEVWPATDAGLRGVAVLDASGTVVVGTEDRLIGVNLAHRSFVREALRGAAVTSDVYFAEPEVGGAPTLAFLAPIWGPDKKLLGLTAFWVHASVLHDVLKQSSGLAGPDSFAVLVDRLGIRNAHSSSNELLYLPSVALAPATIDALVAEQRFGARTRQLLEDVHAALEVHGTASGSPLDPAMFRGFAPGNQQWNFVVARSLTTASWTLYYFVPERALLANIARLTQQSLLFATGIMLVALVVGALFAAAILKPVRSLSDAARAIAGGAMDTRVAITRQDELGELGVTFNTMAERIQQQAAALLQESEAKYRKLFESLTEGFCTVQMIFDADNKPVDFEALDTNAAFKRHTGLDNVHGKRVREVVPGIESYWVEILGKVALTGEAVHFEQHAEPLGRYFEVSAYRVGAPDDRKVAVVFSNITERRDAELRQQAQLQRLGLLQQITRAIGERHDLASIYQVVIRTLEDRLPIDFGCICLYESADSRLIVTHVGLHSQELAMELALTEQSLVGIDENGLASCVRGQLVYESDVSEVQHPFPQRLAKVGLRALVAVPLLVESRVFGVLIAARYKANSFSSGDCEFLQQLSEHVALAADHAQLYSALQAAYEDLRRSQQTVMQQERLRSLGQMASGIAHDINNAISPVALYTDSLLEREANISAQGRGQLQTIQRAIQDVAATLARMREFYREREPQLQLAPVQLNDLIPQVVELTRPRWSTQPQQRGVTIKLQTDLHPGLPAIMGAEHEIREALTNLVLNAVDAMPQGGTLTLRTNVASSRRVQIEVSDTGVGMDDEARGRCLEPFFTTKGERGTGLGLAMVYGVAQRHSAEVEIDSAVGRGTTVRLSFAATEDAVSLLQPATPIVPTGLRILVVDDDPLLLRILRHTLEADGHEVIVANGGQQGIDLFRASQDSKQAFSAVITDLGMPNVDGRQVASALKAMSPATPVIMLTGWGQRMLAESDIPAHVDLVLSKPPKLRDLRNALAQCCGAVKA